MKSSVAVVILVCVVSFGRTETSDEYNAKIEAAITKAIAEGAVIEKQEVTTSQVAFNCPQHDAPADVPDSVHRLRPGDIKVVTAIGDSLTAAQGAKASTVFTVLTNYRGVAFSIGGDNGAVTVADFIKKYNSEVTGFSVGTGDANSKGAGLNVAVSGAKAADIEGQAKELVNRLQTNQLFNEWKLVTIFIGANDLCAYCKNTELYSASKYKENVKKALDILKTIPRTFVNLVNILDINPLSKSSGLVCGFVRIIACDCAGKDNEEQAKAPKEYQDALRDLANDNTYRDSDTFAVVLQPFLQDYVVPLDKNGNLDTGYFAPDCFHFNEKAHGSVATGLWNNMFEPEGSKTIDWDVTAGTQPKCPNEDEYLATWKNSKKNLATFLSTHDDFNKAHSGRSSYYSVIVSTSTVGVVVCVGTVLLVTVLVAWRVRRGRSQKSAMTGEQLPLVKSRV